MAIILPDNRSLALPTWRAVLLGLTASLLSAPAIVRVTSIMPVRRVLITEADRPQEDFVRPGRPRSVIALTGCTVVLKVGHGVYR